VKGQPRSYTIVVQCVDESGNTSSESVTIRVSPEKAGAN
jgi:hypothetical protein